MLGVREVNVIECLDLLEDIIGPEEEKPRLSPERRLMLAVLDDAVTILATAVDSTDPNQVRLWAEAHDWVYSRDGSWLFSFERVWEELFNGWSVEKARQLLLADPKGVWKRLRRYSRKQTIGLPEI